MRDEASKAIDRFRQEEARTPLTAQQRQQIVNEVLPDLVPRVWEVLQDTLPAPSRGSVTLQAEDVQLLAEQLEPLLRERLFGSLGPPPVSDPIRTTEVGLPQPHPSSGPSRNTLVQLGPQQTWPSMAPREPTLEERAGTLPPRLSPAALPGDARSAFISTVPTPAPLPSAPARTYREDAAGAASPRRYAQKSASAEIPAVVRSTGLDLRKTISPSGNLEMGSAFGRSTIACTAYA